MNIMPVISVVIFLILVIGAIVAYRFLRRKANDTDGAHIVNEWGKPGISSEKDVIGKG